MNELKAHPDLTIQFLNVGKEQQPLMIVDNLLVQPDSLIDYAMSHGGDAPAQGYYPGMRAPAPKSYSQAILEFVNQNARDHFSLSQQSVISCDSCFSMVTTAVADLSVPQSVPHFDRPKMLDIAAIHYLCDEKFGGTSLYRHKETGYEYIDESRLSNYLASQQQGFEQCGKPKGYINGDSAMYERIFSVKAKFNRAVFYRCSSLHSGDIANDYRFIAHPKLGRFTATSFLSSAVN